jgi:hypothetical protein
MKTIPLSQGKVALVDDEDYQRVSAFKWSAALRDHKWYACRNLGRQHKQQLIYLHRFIVDAPTGCEVDHEDGNGLNCMRLNLRKCTPVQNRCNTGLSVRNKSGFKGVHWRRDIQKWAAQIKTHGYKISLGVYDSAEAAARVRDVAARKYHGEFAWLNFPQEGA